MFRHQNLNVYNLYGQKVALTITTKPNCFGYVEVLDDAVGQYCLENNYYKAIALHHFQYAERYIEKRNRREDWEWLHHDCLVCLGHKAEVKSLNEVPEWNLDRLFVDSERFQAPLRKQKLMLLPPPDINATAVGKLPDDETTILELKRELTCHKIAGSLYVASLKAERKLLKEKVLSLKGDLWQTKRDLEEATKMIRQYSLIIKALPDPILKAVEKVEEELERKLDELLVRLQKLCVIDF